MKKTFLLLWFCNAAAAFAQFAPPAGKSGSGALPATHPAFKAWASTCILTRGDQNIKDPSLGLTTVGKESDALGAPGINGVISLGDNGSALLTFDEITINKPGPDFAVFENSFNDSFLELAFVEVSSDGVRFVRFPATSLSQDTLQYGNDAVMDATKINNLAGKYRNAFGTPFDLEELKDSANVNIFSISHIRIVDVIGTIEDGFATFDHSGNKINDPWPTPFISGGFDLDAVGSIDQDLLAVYSPVKSNYLNMYFDPSKDMIALLLPEYSVSTDPIVIEVKSVRGQLLANFTLPYNRLLEIPMSGSSTGVYFITMQAGEQYFTGKICKQ